MKVVYGFIIGYCISYIGLLNVINKLFYYVDIMRGKI